MSDIGGHRGPGVVLRHGELFLKGQNRFLFERVLTRNVRRALVGREGLAIEPEHGRTFVVGPIDGDVVARLAEVFGVATLSEAVFPERNEQAMAEAAVALAVARRGDARSFRISARRSDKRFPLNSLALERLIGHAVQQATGLSVDLERFELEVGVEVGPRWCFVWADTRRGAGGLPVGTTGRGMLLLSGGIDSPVAGHLMQKRGMELAAVYFHSFPYTGDGARQKVIDLARILARRQGRLKLFVIPFAAIQEALRDHSPPGALVVLYRRAMLRIAERLAQGDGSPALITGESIGQVASQTLSNLVTIEDAATMPILRPLIGFDKREAVELAQRIGTFEISIRPHDDCCSLFVPRHPQTKSAPRHAARAERHVDLAALSDEAIAGAEIVEL